MAPAVIIIIGPTASGKTFLAEHAAIHYGGEIINADMGQFYTPLTIGTAKPVWRDKPFKCHLFDVIDIPETLDVRRYRQMVQTTVDHCHAQHTLPIIVGGSLFYVQSLFFPPHTIEYKGEESPIDVETDTQTLWNMLNTIDSERAQALHPNDRYRIVRALNIWQTTRQKPSTLKPSYRAPFAAPTHIIALEPPREELCKRIQQRTTDMMYKEGWLEETEKLIDTPWESFIQQRGFIGYTEIIAWIRAGKNRDSLPELIALISQKTQQYAKRQLTFWHKLEKLLAPHHDANLTVDVLPTTGEKTLQAFNDLCQKFDISK
jgi:tRNA dimethylallyltransferase